LFLHPNLYKEVREMEDHLEIDHSDIPIRLFKSDFLEFFTHIHPITIIIIWTPIIGYFFYWGYSLRGAGESLAYLPLSFLVGLLIWSFAEYNIHRFFFHFHPKSAWQNRIVFLFHGVHHAQPKMKARLVMPPVVSLPMGLVFFLVFNLLVGHWMSRPEWVGPLLSGFSLGYLIYDLMHYATHHFPMRWGVFKYLKRHHMLHHYKTPDLRFGVSSPLWDIVYGTLPKD
jgi:dihydroceramide fatty acyl 2-hydroxylase